MKRNYLLNFCFFCMILGLLQSCSKDELLSESEINARKIQSVIDNENISIVSVYQLHTDQWVNYDSSSDFEIAGTFIRVEDTFYSLEKLQSYRINIYASEGVYLYLYLN